MRSPLVHTVLVWSFLFSFSGKCLVSPKSRGIYDGDSVARFRRPLIEPRKMKIFSLHVIEENNNAQKKPEKLLTLMPTSLAQLNTFRQAKEHDV